MSGVKEGCELRRQEERDSTSVNQESQLKDTLCRGLLVLYPSPHPNPMTSFLGCVVLYPSPHPNPMTSFLWCVKHLGEFCGLGSR